MNYPGVIQGDPELIAMIAQAKKNKKPVDGHAPGFTRA
jgi:adenine deaminase